MSRDQRVTGDTWQDATRSTPVRAHTRVRMHTAHACTCVVHRTLEHAHTRETARAPRTHRAPAQLTPWRCCCHCCCSPACAQGQRLGCDPWPCSCSSSLLLPDQQWLLQRGLLFAGEGRASATCNRKAVACSSRSTESEGSACRAAVTVAVAVVAKLTVKATAHVHRASPAH